MTGVVGLASAFTVAGVAAGGFAAVAVTDISNATAANQKLLAAQVAVNDATTSKGREEALAKQAALITQIGQPTIQLGQAIKALSDDWHSFAEAFQPEVLTLFQTVASGLAQVLPEITPVIAAGAIAVNLVAKEFVAALASPTGQKFFQWIATEAGPIILRFADMFLQFGRGVIGVFEAFTPLTNAFITGLDHAAQSFGKWGTDLAGSSGFQKFIDYMLANGPLLMGTLADLGKFVIQLLIDLAPLAPVMLQFLDAVAKTGTAILQNLEPALAAFGKWLSSNPQLIQQVVAGLFEITIIGSQFASTFGTIITDAGKAFGFLANILADFAEGAGKAFGGILHGAVDAFGWVPDVGDKLRKAQADFRDFAASAVSDLRAVAIAAESLGAVSTAGGAGPHGQLHGQALADALAAPRSGGAASGGDSAFNAIMAMYNQLIASLKLGTGSAPGALSGVPGGLSGFGGSSAAANNAAGIAGLLGLNLMQSLAQGITSGTNPLTVAFSDLNQKLTGPAQSLATVLESSFGSMLSFAQAAAKSLGFSVTAAPTVGTQTLITGDGRGGLTSTVQSQLVGSSFNALVTDQRFVADIAKAKALGLSAGLLGQFVQAGPSSLATLDALVNSGAGAVAELNQNNAAIDALGNQYGVQTASDKYLPDIHADLQQLIALQKQAPAAHGQATAAALDHTAGAAKLAANNTPQLGAYSRGGRR